MPTLQRLGARGGAEVQKEMARTRRGKFPAPRSRARLCCWAGRSQLIGMMAWNCGFLSTVGTAFRLPTTASPRLWKLPRACRSFSSVKCSGERGMDKSIAQTELEGFYWQGGDTMKISRTLHTKNRRKVLEHMKKQGANEGIIVVEGGRDINRADTDHTLLFRQESNFHYLFGVGFPDCFGTIDISSGRNILFVPRQPESYSVWMGSPPSLEDLKSIYCVDEVLYTSDLPDHVSAARPSTIYTYGGQNSDSGNEGKPANFEGIGG